MWRGFTEILRCGDIISILGKLLPLHCLVFIASWIEAGEFAEVLSS